MTWRLVSDVLRWPRSVPAASHEIRVAAGPGLAFKFDLQVPKAHLVLKRSSTIDYHSSKLQFEAPSLHFVLIFLAPPRRQPARAMNSHDRRPGPSPSLGSSVAQAGRAVKQGFELGTETALQIARLSWFSRPCRSGPSGKKSGRPGTRGWRNEMKGRQCYLFGNLLVKFQSSWILMLIQCFIFRKIMLYWIFAWHKLLRYNSVVILDACKVMSCLLEIFSISAIYLSSLWY